MPEVAPVRWEPGSRPAHALEMLRIPCDGKTYACTVPGEIMYVTAANSQEMLVWAMAGHGTATKRNLRVLSCSGSQLTCDLPLDAVYIATATIWPWVGHLIDMP